MVLQESGTQLKLLSLTWVGAQFCKDIDMHYLWKGTRTLPLRLPYHLTAATLLLYPLPSLISNNLNLHFGTYGRPRRLNETISCKKEKRNRGNRKDLYSGSPSSSAKFQFRELGYNNPAHFLLKWVIFLP